MNYYCDKNIQKRVQEHYNEALELFPENQIVGIFLHGSQDYGVETKFSDVDTKLIILPSFHDLALNKKPISITHIRKNNEHIDIKDIREMFSIFRKQNPSFIEILFTDYKILNPKYEKLWDELISHGEEISHYDKVKTFYSTYNVAKKEYLTMEKPTEARKDIFDKFKYDPKNLHHQLRMEYFLMNYLQERPYKECLKLNDEKAEALKRIKEGRFSLNQAREVSSKSMKRLNFMMDNFKVTQEKNNVKNSNVESFLNHTQEKMIELYLKDYFRERDE